MTRGRVYLDTHVFIAAFEQASARADHARWVLDAVEAGRLHGVTSELTLAETLVKPLQTGSADLVDAYEHIMRDAPGFDVLPVSREVLVEAARIRAERTAIRLPDAIHVATARRAGCTALVSSDRRLTTARGPRPVGLGPFTLDEIERDAP